MALVSNIVLDLALQTATLTVTRTGDTVEVITYSNSGKTCTFSPRDEILITGDEFIDLCIQIQILQTCILFKFNPNQFVATPFTEIQSLETNATSTWDFIFSLISLPDPNVVEYSAILADSTVDLLGRHGNHPLEFAEWMYFLFCLNHYKLSVQKFLNV